MVKEERESTMKKTILALLLVCAVCSIVSAITITPDSTDQKWDFDTDANPAIPEYLYNPYGNVEAAITYAGTIGEIPSWSDGVWSGTSIKFTTTIPNTRNTDPESYKDIVVEIGFQGNISLATITAWGDAFSRTKRETSAYQDNSGQVWTLVRDYYVIKPNPTEEEICYALSDFFGGEQKLDYVSIYTVCIPEPATVCLLGLGALALVVSRRKRLY